MDKRSELHPCLSCGQVKPLAEFYRDSEIIGKTLRGKCLACLLKVRRDIYAKKVGTGDVEAKVAPLRFRIAILTRHGYSESRARQIIAEGL